MYVGFHVTVRYSCQILVKLEFSRQIFQKYPHVEFNENPLSGGRVGLFGQTDGQTDGQTERQT
jgi:hypothetical protein